MSITDHINYERLPNGLDTYLLKTPAHDIIMARIVLPGGTHTVYEHPMRAALFGMLMPGGTNGMGRRTVRETFARLGARVSIAVEAEHLVLTVAARKTAFDDAFRLAIQCLVAPRVTAREHAEALATLATDIEHSKEDTSAQAALTLRRTFYQHGHPLWTMSSQERAQDLARTSLEHVRAFPKDTLTAIGGFACVVGDIRIRTHAALLKETLAALPGTRPNKSPISHPGNTNQAYASDTILSMRERMNIDLLLGIPLALTTEHEDYYALALGVHVLGGSATGRLFHSLRTQKSLTYGAYATLAGMTDVHAGFLKAATVVPNDVFAAAQTALRDDVVRWVEAGVTPKEVAAHKEEIVGRMQVGLASSAGLLAALGGTLQSNKPVSHIDEYPNIVASLTPRAVNRAITTHLDPSLMATVAAGAIDEKGRPLA